MGSRRVRWLANPAGIRPTVRLLVDDDGVGCPGDGEPGIREASDEFMVLADHDVQAPAADGLIGVGTDPEVRPIYVSGVWHHRCDRRR